MRIGHRACDCDAHVVVEHLLLVRGQLAARALEEQGKGMSERTRELTVVTHLESGE